MGHFITHINRVIVQWKVDTAGIDWLQSVGEEKRKREREGWRGEREKEREGREGRRYTTMLCTLPYLADTYWERYLNRKWLHTNSLHYQLFTNERHVWSCKCIIQ
jgi:hypothetical protein